MCISALGSFTLYISLLSDRYQHVLLSTLDHYQNITGGLLEQPFRLLWAPPNPHPALFQFSDVKILDVTTDSFDDVPRGLDWRSFCTSVKVFLKARKEFHCSEELCMLAGICFTWKVKPAVYFCPIYDYVLLDSQIWFFFFFFFFFFHNAEHLLIDPRE